MSLPQAESSRAGAGDNRPPCAHTKLEEIFPYAPVSFAQIRSSATSCRICHLYMEIILAVVAGALPGVFHGPRDEAEETLILESLTLFYEMGLPKDLCFNILVNRISIDIFRDRFADGHRDFTIQGRRFPKRSPVGPRTDSEESFAKARQWLHECVTSHDCLKPSSTGPRLPKRLLDVRGSSREDIRLIETQGDEYPYACLSHRWGTAEHRRLTSTTRTIQDHMTKITWDGLPATFQDAVTICRRMGVDYCWIDSLCILQNADGLTADEIEATKLDFAQENSVMANTYHNSHFTISADLSTHMDSGIFSKSLINDYRIVVTDDAGDHAALCFRQSTNHQHEEEPDLETRGWTFQEVVLARRVLHFGAFDIEWRCADRHACECGQLYIEKDSSARWHRHHHLAEVARPVPHSPGSALNWWASVVENYTKRELTDPADKLPALSGLAQLYKEARGGTYLAGLWQDSLLHDLCWYHEPSSNFDPDRLCVVARRPAGYRAPSWSWASLDASCTSWLSAWSELTQVCTVFESSCRPLTADTTGGVQIGFLDIGVVLIPATTCLEASSSYQMEAYWGVTDVKTDLRLCRFYPDSTLETECLSVGEQVYCAPIADTVYENPTRFRRHCLVLKKLYSSFYQRVGFCCLEVEPLRVNYRNYALPDNEKSRIIII